MHIVFKVSSPSARNVFKNKKKQYRLINADKIKKQEKKSRSTAHSKERDKAYRAANKDKYRALSKDWRDCNKEAKRQYALKYKETQNKKNRERYKTDVKYRLMRNLRARMTHALRSDKKVDTMVELMGSMEEFKAYLESRFLPGMSWDNYGHGVYKWHIDHQMPCTRFDLSKKSEQRLCFHYSNMQPLWAIDNLKKGGTFDIEEDTLTSIYLLFQD